VPVGPVPVRLRHGRLRDLRVSTGGPPAPLLREGAAARRCGGVARQVPGAGPFPAGRAALADRWIKDQPGGEGSSAELARL
jgi:hypothetical protein